MRSPSSHGLPINCNPRGSPLESNLAGTEIPGSPARFTVTVNTSFRYILIGSSSLISPRAKAGLGVVGVRIASTPSLNTSSKSFLINVLIFVPSNNRLHKIPGKEHRCRSLLFVYLCSKSFSSGSLIHVHDICIGIQGCPVTISDTVVSSQI